MTELPADILRTIYIYSDSLVFAFTNYYYAGLFALINDCGIPALYQKILKRILRLDKKKHITSLSLEDAARRRFPLYNHIKQAR